MKSPMTILLCAAAALLTTAITAQAQAQVQPAITLPKPELPLPRLPQLGPFGPLRIANVTAQALDCLFHPKCAPTLTDSVANIPMAGITGNARLRTRTFVAAASTPAVGRTAYLYQVDLSEAVALGEFACITDIVIDFGSVAQLQYDAEGLIDDAAVVSQGDVAGTIGLLSGRKAVNLLTFSFDQPVCTTSSPETGQLSHFFGLASMGDPRASKATIIQPGAPDTIVAETRTPGRP